MKKLFFVLLVVMVFCESGNAYDVAEKFSFPLSSYVVGCNGLGGECYKPYHLGEDANASENDKVYAIADGKVKWAKYHAPTYDEENDRWIKNYGGLYIIEHTLVDGEKVCSLYSHMDFGSFTKSVGRRVKS